MKSIVAFRTGYVEYVLPYFKNNDFAITLTYRETEAQHSSKYVPNYQKTSQDIKHFLNIINRKVYGRQSKSHKKRLKCVNVFEFNTSTGLHVHMVLENPADWQIPEAEKASLILNAWMSMKYSGSEKANKIFLGYEINGWINYCFKNINYYNTERIDVANLHLDSKINAEIIQ
jgi:hypothetical protein